MSILNFESIRFEISIKISFIFADIGATILESLGITDGGIAGESFYRDVVKGE